MKSLKLHWSSSLKNGKKNFGDWLSPVIIEHFSKMRIVHAEPNAADLLAVGSILQRLKNNFWSRETNIWGSGFIADQERVNFKHKIHAIRGKKVLILSKTRILLVLAILDCWFAKYFQVLTKSSKLTKLV